MPIRKLYPDLLTIYKICNVIIVCLNVCFLLHSFICTFVNVNNSY